MIVKVTHRYDGMDFLVVYGKRAVEVSATYGDNNEGFVDVFPVPGKTASRRAIWAALKEVAQILEDGVEWWWPRLPEEGFPQT